MVIPSSQFYDYEQQVQGQVTIYIKYKIQAVAWMKKKQPKSFKVPNHTSQGQSPHTYQVLLNGFYHSAGFLYIFSFASDGDNIAVTILTRQVNLCVRLIPNLWGNKRLMLRCMHQKGFMSCFK